MLPARDVGDAVTRELAGAVGRTDEDGCAPHVRPGIGGAVSPEDGADVGSLLGAANLRRHDHQSRTR